MGQYHSQPSKALSPIEQRARIIAAVVGDEPPAPVFTVIEGNEDADRIANAVFNAEGFSNLRTILRDLIAEVLPLHEAVILVAQQNNEPASTAWKRFALRYVGESELVADHTAFRQKGEYVASMMRDELDLPGFGLNAALRRWRRIVKRAGRASFFDRDQAAELRINVLAFLHDHGLTRLIDCLQSDHSDELGVQEALSLIVGVYPRTGERILYEPLDHTRYANNAVIAQKVRDWLVGEAPLLFPRYEPGHTPSRAAWARHLLDEVDPTTEDESIDSVIRAVRAVPLEWDVVYYRALRQMNLFGIVRLVETFLEFLEQTDKVDFDAWMNRSVDQLIASGRRARAADGLAAVIADYFTTTRRDERNVALNLDWVPANVRPTVGVARQVQTTPSLGQRRATREIVEESPDDSPTPANGIRETPKLDLGPKSKNTRKAQAA